MCIAKGCTEAVFRVCRAHFKYCARYYQYRDRLGSSVIEANERGQVISYEEYYPYGSTAYSAAASGVDLSLKRYRFTGKERDEETGLDYFGVRYYASWLGRWTSGRPGGFVDGLNMYRYVRNNPVNGIDREGYCTCPPDCPDCPKYEWGSNSGGSSIDTDPTNSSVRPTVPSENVHIDVPPPFGTGMTKIELYRAANELVLNGADLPIGSVSELSSIYDNTVDFYSNPFPSSLNIEDSSIFSDLYENHILLLNSNNAGDQQRAINSIDLQGDYLFNNGAHSVPELIYGAFGATAVLLKSLKGLAKVGAKRLAKINRVASKSTDDVASIPELSKIANDVDVDPKTAKRLTGSMQSRFKKFTDAHISGQDVELHHIIPEEMAEHAVIQSASKAGFDIQSLNNGIPLPKYSKTRNLPDGVHATHPQLNKYVTNKLDEIGRLRLDDAGNAAAVKNLRVQLRSEIELLMNNAKKGGENRINEYYRLKN